MKQRRLKDKICGYLLYVPVGCTVAAVAVIAVALYLKARPLLADTSLLQCLTSTDWHPLRGNFGFLPFIVGTLAVTAVAMAIAVPVSILCAIYLTEYASRRLSSLVRPVIDVLAAIPSIIYGICGVICVVPLVGKLGDLCGHPNSGYTLLAAGIVLAVMIIPVIISVSCEVLSAVPLEAREALLALGATRWETTCHVVLRIAAPGIIAAFVLGLSRAFGETMAVMMVAGNVATRAHSLFEPVYTLPSLIANNYGEMMSIPLYDSALMLAALILLVVVALFNTAAHLTLHRAERRI